MKAICRMIATAAMVGLTTISLVPVMATQQPIDVSPVCEASHHTAACCAEQAHWVWDATYASCLFMTGISDWCSSEADDAAGGYERNCLMPQEPFVRPRDEEKASHAHAALAANLNGRSPR